MNNREIIIDTTWREAPEIYQLPGGKHRSITEILPPIDMEEAKRIHKISHYRERSEELGRSYRRSANRSLVLITALSSVCVGLCLGCQIIGAMTPVVGALGVAGLSGLSLFGAANMSR